MKNLDNLYEELLKIEKLLDINDDEALTRLLDFENEFLSHYDVENERNYQQTNRILQKIKYLKQEYNVYNPEDELDMMFPNRQDDDFNDDFL